MLGFRAAATSTGENFPTVTGPRASPESVSTLLLDATLASVFHRPVPTQTHLPNSRNTLFHALDPDGHRDQRIHNGVGSIVTNSIPPAGQTAIGCPQDCAFLFTPARPARIPPATKPGPAGRNPSAHRTDPDARSAALWPSRRSIPWPQRRIPPHRWRHSHREPARDRVRRAVGRSRNPRPGSAPTSRNGTGRAGSACCLLCHRCCRVGGRIRGRRRSVRRGCLPPPAARCSTTARPLHDATIHPGEHPGLPRSCRRPCGEPAPPRTSGGTPGLKSTLENNRSCDGAAGCRPALRWLHESRR